MNIDKYLLFNEKWIGSRFVLFLVPEKLLHNYYLHYRIRIHCYNNVIDSDNLKCNYFVIDNL